MNQYRYAMHDDTTFEEAECFDSVWGEEDVDCIAKDVAEDYYSGIAGDWEWNESMSIQLFKEDGTSLGVFNVGYDLGPQFWARAEGPAQCSSLC